MLVILKEKMKYASILFVLLPLSCSASEKSLPLTRSNTYSLPRNWPKNKISVPEIDSSEQKLYNYKKTLFLFGTPESAVLTIRNNTEWSIGLSLTTRYNISEVGEFSMIEPHTMKDIPLKKSPQKRFISFCDDEYEKKLPIAMKDKTIFIAKSKPHVSNFSNKKPFTLIEKKGSNARKKPKPTYRRRSIG